MEKEERPSSISVEPTVIASKVDAGDFWHASPLLFPAATTVRTPAAIAAWMTASYRFAPPPPRDIERTAGRSRICASATAHSMPAITPA